LNDSELLDDFMETRDQYLSNAEHVIAAGEYRKASELLWGAVTQQLKALAASHNILTLAIASSLISFANILQSPQIENWMRIL
jgi:hypothetical protein